ncbi:SpaH/EbpB family LPXTG-anchored major pilin [Neoactinobaculum massilliense]|uniref:SpaH/EbpB family LPXTG-anchored major pilin n=1 Tax=Neoactinobaculum massilliense TaxID=2364794 RepID=UPI000F530D0B|nr:SpaH/EbpB family LPXTG-anchored major pilin [Neoactinobaculum massilliense]
MKKQGTSTLRLLVATALAALLALLGVSTRAFAAGETSGADTTSTLGAGNIDVTKTGSINIHKYLNPTAVGGAANGEVQDNVSGTPLAGVQFKITKLNLDLSNQANLKTASTLTADDAAALTTDTTYTVTTGADGSVSQAVPVGVYLVEESDVSGATANGQAVTGIAKSAPFVVRVPMTSSDGKSWNYDVNVYPKNTNATVVKSVQDAGKNVGDTITYTINTSVPSVADNSKRTKYVITDSINAGDANTNNTDVSDGAVAKVVQGDTVFTEGDDYTVTTSATAPQFTISFTEAGLAKLTNGATVTTTITAKIKAIGDSNGKIENTASLIYNNPNASGSDTDITVPGNTVDTYLGKVQINKTGLDGKALSGATFELYQCTDATEAGLQGNALTVNNATSFTTDTNGQAVIDGLHVTDFADNAAATQPSFCLKETAAPAGYVLPEGDAAITKFTLTKAELQDAATPVNIKALPAITNTASSTPSLPLTGGQGIALIVVIGAALLGGAYVVSRRNKKVA